MKRRRWFSTTVSEVEQELLKRLADVDGVSKSDVVRQLVRREAVRRGLWPKEGEGDGRRAA